MRIAFLHPDLGLGGAERLVVDAAVALRMERHEVTMFTSHYEPDRCFEETKDESLFKVTVYGDWLPREILGGLHIVFAMLRNAWLALCVAWLHDRFDVIICDQVSVSVPVLRLFAPHSRILFYCHFPDQLLSPRRSLLKTLYRLPFDLIEEATTLLADKIVVNSRFTAGVFAQTFTCARGMRPEVLYPCIRVDEDLKYSEPRKLPARTADGEPGRVFVSINRFERKKNLPLALEAFAAMRESAGSGAARSSVLVLAGGYDPRLRENTTHFAELEDRCKELGLASHVATGEYDDAMEEVIAEGADVLFVRSFSDADKVKMLRDASLVVYTPRGEHFGIVPIEAMAAWRPVLAVDDAGPKESVLPGTTGYLEDDSAGAFAARMSEVAEMESSELESKCRAARERAVSTFTAFAMQRQLGAMVTDLVERPPPRQLSMPLLAATVLSVSVMLLAWLVA